MQLKATLQADMIAAMKSKDSSKLSAIKNIKAKITEAEKKDNTEISDSDVIKILQKLASERRAGIDTAKSANRLDILEKEQFELTIIESYLPKQLDATQIESILLDIKSTNNLSGIKSMGILLKEFNSKYQGTADSKIVGEIAKKILNG